MNYNKRYRGLNLLDVLYSVGPAALLTLFLWTTRSNLASPVETAAAFVLLLMPLHSYRQWKKRHSEEIPLFAMFAFMYWLYYALQLFWGSLAVSTTYSAIDREIGAEKIRDAI